MTDKHHPWVLFLVGGPADGQKVTVSRGLRELRFQVQKDIPEFIYDHEHSPSIARLPATVVSYVPGYELAPNIFIAFPKTFSHDDRVLAFAHVFDFYAKHKDERRTSHSQEAKEIKMSDTFFPWEQAPEWARWAGMDDDGYCQWFMHEPTIMKEYNGLRSWAVFGSVRSPIDNFQDTIQFEEYRLIKEKRPDDAAVE